MLRIDYKNPWDKSFYKNNYNIATKTNMDTCDVDSTEPCETCTDERLVLSKNRCDAICISGDKGRCKRPSKYPIHANGRIWRVCYGHKNTKRFRAMRESNDLSTENNFYRMPKDMQNIIKRYAAPVMISRWQLDDHLFVKIPLSTTSQYGNIEIRWGDGEISFLQGEDNRDDDKLGHWYEHPGDYTVEIIGKITGFTFRGASDEVKSNILEINQWGDVHLDNNGKQFRGCINLTRVAKPHLKYVTDMNHMFHGATNFNGDISDWDTSRVEDMSGMFQSAERFNGDISSWETGNVTDMAEMFNNAHSFNGDISRWNTMNVENMALMFTTAKSYNGDMPWDTRNVKDMSGMFQSAERFNGDISSWKTMKVTDMSWMFQSAEGFNGDISSWNPMNVTDMSGMFQSAERFNGDISSWNTMKVTDMSVMFDYAIAFNGDISKWNTSEVTNMRYMFYNARSFDSNMPWDTRKVTNMKHMFHNATSFNGDISIWKTRKVNNMRHMFHNATSFNGDIRNWDTRKVKNMSQMFSNATSFNGDIRNWDTSNVVNVMSDSDDD